MHEWDHPQLFWVFNFSSPAPRADRPQRGKRHVGRHCPYTNKIWCGSVHALLRYRSQKQLKCKNSPLTPIVTKISFPSFSVRRGAANPQKGRRHTRNQSTPACKLWRESARRLSRNRWPNKKNKCVSKTDTNPTFAFQIAFPRGTDFAGFLHGGSKSRDLQSEISVRIESRIESADSRLQLQC